MRASEETYEKVARACSEFDPEDTTFSFKKGCECQDCETSCCTCTHFSEDEYCKLDLFDKIVDRIDD